MVRIRRFGVVKTATTVAMIYVVIVAIFAIPFALLAAATGGVATTTGRIGPVEVLTFAVVAMLLYGIFGWVFTAIACAVYNLAARFTGGIEVEVDRVAPPAPLPTWGPATGAPPAPPNAG